jgi:hypothetical protein
MSTRLANALRVGFPKLMAERGADLDSGRKLRTFARRFLSAHLAGVARTKATPNRQRRPSR